MGKFDNRDKMPGQGSHENHATVSFSGKTNFKNRKFSRSIPYFSDPLLLPRISQYLEDNKDKVYIDINDMVNDLQSHYKEYARRKRNVFRQSVQKAFSTVLQQYGLSQGSMEQDDEYVGSTDNSSSEVEECNISDNEEKLKSSANNQLINLYKPSPSQLPTKLIQKYPSENAELIDLSSDDENLKANDAEDEKGDLDETKNNGIDNDSQGRETPTNSPRRNSVKTVKTERGGFTSRKRKLGTHPDRLLHATSSPTKQRKTSFQESRVTFADFGGNTKALEEVCKLILHIQHPELYKKIGLSSPRGFLLHGPPGCGKTLLASAIAGELEVYFLKISAPELIGGVSGESEERIRELFENAVECSPCVLFIDEVDAITPNRQNAQKEMERRIVAQLLTCLDELSNQPNGDQVLVIGATNRPDALDPALRRAGRFDKEVCLGIPDLKAREQILRVVCKNLKMAPNFSYEQVAESTPGFVGADLLALTREAAMSAINRVFGALHHQRKNKSKAKKLKLESKETKASEGEEGKVGKVSEDEGSKAENDVDDSVEVDIIENGAKGSEEDGDKDEGKSGGDDKSEKKNGVNSPMDVELDAEKGEQSSTGRSATEKHDSDMDIAETVSEESVSGEVKDIEICKEDSVKMVNSEDESEVEVLPANYDCGPPTLDTLLSWLRDTPPLTSNELKNVFLTQEDFSRALRCVQPSAKREGFATVPDVTWDDIGSLAEVREELKMSILGPVKLRKQYEQLGLSAPSGILICGPPGCGKTLLAKAVANEAGINFISVKGPELLNMYVGESERAVRQCFQRARNSAPCVIFFDELDALCPKRSGSGENGASMRVVNQMLTEMDGVEDRKEVYLMAATNRPDIVDPAVLRPGRLDKILYVGLPGEDDRVDILRAVTKNGTRPRLASEVNLAEIARRPECNGYSGADLAALVREAGIQALKDLLAKTDADGQSDVVVEADHFERALKLVRPSVSPQDREHYESLRQRYCAAK